MILPFSTKIDGKETFFVEKIIKGLIKNSIISIDKASELLDIPISQISKLEIKPKIHTIRDDKNNRWKAGNKIDFFINARQKNMYRFAPVLPVVRIQNFEIVYETSFYRKRHPVVFINNVMFYDAVGHRNEYKMLDFVNSDGFDTIEDFFDYFDKDYKGKIIHWTDLEY